MPASFCVLRNEGSTNYYSAAKLQNDRGREDARLWLLFFVTEYMFFSLLFMLQDVAFLY